MSLEELWPDPDRRDAALTRLLIRIHTGADTQKNESRGDPGVAAYVAAKAWVRLWRRIR